MGKSLNIVLFDVNSNAVTSMPIGQQDYNDGCRHETNVMPLYQCVCDFTLP